VSATGEVKRRRRHADKISGGITEKYSIGENNMKKYIVTIVNRVDHRFIEADSYEVESPFVYFVATKEGIKSRVALFNIGAIECIVEEK